VSTEPGAAQPAIIDTLIAAVRNGELDEHLAQGSKVGMIKKRKAA
jgi:hypothetical protein